MTFTKISAAGTIHTLVGLGLWCAIAAAPAAAQTAMAATANAQTGAGIYFPAVTSRETVSVRFGSGENEDAQPRQLFVDQINLVTTSAERTIPIIAQAVGQDRKTLVIMNIEPHEFLTPYVARAMLARMSSLARFLPEVSKNGLSADFDIYNLASVIGFERIVATDGRKFAHEVTLARAPAK